MNCPRCQKEIPDTALFCTKCGLKLSARLENCEDTMEEETTESFGCGGNAFLDSEFAPSPFGDTVRSYEDSYTSYTSYGTGDGWDPYSQILQKKEEPAENGATESEPAENEAPGDESSENVFLDKESAEEVSEEENVGKKTSKELSDSEGKDSEEQKPSEVIGISSNIQMKKSEENSDTEKVSRRKKGKFPFILMLIMAAAVYAGYQKGFSGDKLVSSIMRVAYSRKTENTNAGAEENFQDLSGEIQEEEPYDTVQEDPEEEIITIYTPAPEPEESGNTEESENIENTGNTESPENTEELFPVSVEQELNIDENSSISDPTENIEDNSEPQERNAFLVEYQEGSMDSSKRIEIVSAEATSTIVQEKTTNEPMLMFDNKRDTNWQEGVDGPGTGQSFTATFQDVAKVKYITFLLGNWKTDKYYYGNNRPKKLTLELDDFKTQIEFPDVWEEFCVEISPACEASSLKVTLDEVYVGTSWDDTVITDICLYRE